MKQPSAANRRAQRGEERRALLGCCLHLLSCASSLYSCLGSHNPPRRLCLSSHSLQTNCPEVFIDLGTFPVLLTLPALPGKAPGAQAAPFARQCSSQHPQASLTPCKVLQVTVRSCGELIQREGSCSCIPDGISEAAAGHPKQKEAGSGV